MYTAEIVDGLNAPEFTEQFNLNMSLSDFSKILSENVYYQAMIKLFTESRLSAWMANMIITDKIAKNEDTLFHAIVLWAIYEVESGTNEWHPDFSSWKTAPLAIEKGGPWLQRIGAEIRYLMMLWC